VRRARHDVREIAMPERNRWALVLAAGDGTRLAALTTGPAGIAVPKQFCRLPGGRTLLGEALRRAEQVVRADHVVVVVAMSHRRWWDAELAGRDALVVAQPRNRGTAVGALLGLRAIEARAPDATVYLLPSDHFVAADVALAGVVRTACTRAERTSDRVVLLGIEPDAPDSGYGWIVPGAAAGGGFRTVDRFVEKPAPDRAAELMAAGAVWNGFLLAARLRTLLGAYATRLPRIAAALGTPETWGDGLGRIYERLETADFSRDLLEGSESRLLVLPVPPCGWSDLGTPDRVAGCAARFGGPTAVEAAVVHDPRPDLFREVRSRTETR